MKLMPVLIIILSFSILSCVVDFSENALLIDTIMAGKETRYDAEVLWDREVFGSYYDLTYITAGKYLYFPANRIPGGGSSVVKIDIETGKVIWESDRIFPQSSQNIREIQIVGEHIYLPVLGYIYILNESNGKLAATLLLGENETEARRNNASPESYTVVSDYLFWGNTQYVSAAFRGVRRLDTSMIDFLKNPYEVQKIAPDLVWTDNITTVTSNIISENGVIYFITWSGILIAMDAETCDIIWEEDTRQVLNNRTFALVLYNDNILIAATGLSSYNKNTGDLIYENFEADKRFASRITLHDNILYCIRNSNRSVIAINADTGETVWNYDLDEDNYYYRTRPYIYEEKLYVMSDSGLRVHNAANGDFTGVNKRTIEINMTHAEYKGIIYNDTLVIFYSGLYTNQTVFFKAIRCK
ncbi:MAG: PQQ-binding-like beta-propeller repeat protein [Treponema sp.]|nr:PQQ-binding-like beta-propeller repeat protein [Treponema sp.]